MEGVEGCVTTVFKWICGVVIVAIIAMAANEQYHLEKLVDIQREVIEGQKTMLVEQGITIRELEIRLEYCK